MQHYSFLEGFPYYPLSDAEGFQIYNGDIRHWKNQQVVNSWDFTKTETPENFPKEWLKQFLLDLEQAPRYVIKEDQWCSSYYSLLNDQVVCWDDDRKSGGIFVNRAQSTQAFLQLATLQSGDLSVKAGNWLRGLLK